mmetsp:Transcript_26313/g.38137  ORF Transcript_26313/g.38137 Transcript_26313/m.38137 type:complete len:133 (-) Transcript_26313:146-544(-)
MLALLSSEELLPLREEPLARADGPLLSSPSPVPNKADDIFRLKIGIYGLSSDVLVVSIMSGRAFKFLFYCVIQPFFVLPMVGQSCVACFYSRLKTFVLSYVEPVRMRGRKIEKAHLGIHNDVEHQDQKMIRR